MAFFSEIVIALSTFAVSLMSSIGYAGLFVLMVLESMVFPVPSELVMPFAGFLCSTGQFNFVLVILVASIGSVVGSLISYFVGKYGGYALVSRFGKYVFLSKEDLMLTHDWFARHGEKTIFIGRLIPIVRHIISLPAGAAKMNLKKFVIFTFMGALLWNTILAYVGLLLGSNWQSLSQYTEPLSALIAVIVVIVIIWFAYRHVIGKKAKKK